MSERARRWLLPAVLALLGCERAEQVASDAPIGAVRFLADEAEDGFARALEPRPFRFPEDHLSHPEFRNEWWYFTGNVFGAAQRHYGFELTLFRVALSPRPRESASAWAGNQVWMAHFALTDTANGRFVAGERLSRGALGTAGSSADPVRIWVEDWSVSIESRAPRTVLTVQAALEEAAIDLELEALKAPVAQGRDGLDPKGPEAGNASYYYSLPRLAVSGTLRAGAAEAETVAGLAWMDREWGTSALSPGLVGWDWFALQLADGRDLMFYRLRESDGGMSPFSGGSLSLADGTTQRLEPQDVELAALDYWTSPSSRARYPLRWRLELPAQALSLEVRPIIPNQELDLSVRYWEGAVEVTGRDNDGAVSGRGYLELAGY